MKYFQGLDLLRFIGASCVVFHHCFQALGDKGMPNPAAKYHTYSGTFFLDVFFIISGFLIASIIFKELNAGIFSFKKYLIRRILRIWPVYFFVVLIVVLILPMKRGIPQDEVTTNFLYAATFLTNFQIIFGDVFKSTYKVFWSVCVEEHLYLIFPFFLLIFRKMKLLLAAFLILIGLFSIFYSATLFTSASGFNVNHFITTTYFYHFGIGILLAYFKMNYQEKMEQVIKILGNFWLQVLISIVGFCVVFNLLTDTPYNDLSITLMSGIFGTWLVFVATNGKLFFDVLGKSTTRFLGNISYAMYLIHPVLVWGFCFKTVIGKEEELIESDVVFSYPLFSLFITIIVATAIHLLVERPFLKMKKNYAVLKTE